ncbi:hypothetical protein [Cyanobium sp. CH-040]|uniref:hypothetical protein n=1 Tax=Cyanobium sp. CH-040 TaxID=2823708 RepID=UPI0020CD7BE3|nr:hypothetical protein [Cyanobium sp. CH-040]MCP9927613.1 hypothetical protein [Cyanobium sp. CH-040]
MPDSVWLVRPRADGGWDYVSFQNHAGVGPAGLSTVEMREGSHLPPQMPLLKRRHRLDPAEAERQRQRLQREAGFHCSKPLF